MTKAYRKRVLPSSRRGQQSPAAGQAAGLIVLILLFIILYILFLPPEDRDALLDDTSTYDSDDDGEGIRESVLLTSPGTIEYLRESGINHTIPSFKLVSLTNSRIIERAESIAAQNSWFQKQTENMSVYIDDVEQTQNMLLSFSIEEAEGELTILFNGRTIFQGTLETGNVDPIRIPVSLIRSENTLSFEVSSVGIQFWKKNRYLLQNVQITADQEDPTTQRSRNVFLVSNTENANMESAKLQYFIDCLSSTVSPLRITINGNQVTHKVPDCNSFSQLELSTDYLTPGENTITFSIEEGSYSVYGIYINTELTEMTNPVYYFELREEEYEELEYGTSDLLLQMRFPDDTTDKVADILVNGHLLRLDDDDETYEADITDYIKEKNNAIKIVPKSQLDIVELEVVID